MSYLIQETSYKSPYYHQSLTVREQILRAPLGLSLSDSDTVDESEQFHFVCVDNDQVIACVVFKPLSKTSLQLRQMAVAKDRQGKGLGAELVKYAEAQMVKKGFQEISMDARAQVVKFYQQLGYQQQGQAFNKLSVPHVYMYKKI